jgi:long-chain fatty acid transport protein
MKTTSLALLAASLLLLPAAALANGYDVPNVNPRDLALAGSGVAAQGDAAAAYANPAAMARLGKGLQFSLGGSLLSISTKWTNTTGGLSPSPASTKFKPAPPVSLFGSYGFDVGGHATAIGAGLNVPAGGNVFWDDNWAGRARIITVDRKIYGAYLSGGFELHPSLRLGATAVYYYGTEYLKQGIQPYPDAFGELTTSGGALSWGVSAEFDVPGLPVTVGADYKYKGKMKLEGEGHFQVPAALSTSVQDQALTHDLTYPSVLNAGVAIHATRALLVTAGFTYNWYNVYKSDDFVGAAGTTITVPRNYDNGYTMRLGVEYTASERLALRVGALRDQSGLKTDTYSPTLPDSNTWAGAVGAGWKLTPDLQLNGTFFYALLDKVTTTGTIVMPGTYETNVWIAAVGLSWRTGVGDQ